MATLESKKTEGNLTRCPCDSGRAYRECCEPYIEGGGYPETPEQLMRSRYTAYSQKNLIYIQETMCGEALDLFDLSSAQLISNTIQWEGLTVISSFVKGEIGVVSFVARYQSQGKMELLTETSFFRKVDGKWLYERGDITSS